MPAEIAVGVPPRAPLEEYFDKAMFPAIHLGACDKYLFLSQLLPVGPGYLLVL
jgi:hypothetical protein